jgi:hypothetical protein
LASANDKIPNAIRLSVTRMSSLTWHDDHHDIRIVPADSAQMNAQDG